MKTAIVGDKGSGPDEFRNPTDMCVSNSNGKERIVVADGSLTRIYVWDGNSNNLIQSLKPKGLLLSD